MLLATTLACAGPSGSRSEREVGSYTETQLLMLAGSAAEAISADDPAAALELLDRAVEGGVSDTTTWFLRGVANLELGRPAAASRDLERAVDLEPDDAPSYCVLARAYRELGELEAAAGSLRRALELDPELARMRTLLGHVYLELGAWGEAYESLLESVAHDPDDNDAHRGLAMLFSQVGDPEQAEMAWRLALDTGTEDPLLHLGLGNALRDQGKLGEAMVSYEAAARIEPDSALYVANGASTLFELGRFRDARIAYEQVLELERLPPRQWQSVLLNFGSLLELMGDEDAALDIYELALSDAPAFTDGHQAMGLLLMQRDRPARALKHLRRALELDGLTAEAAMSLALLSETHGDPEAARQCADMLSLASAADPEVAFRYAQLLMRSRLPEVRDHALAIDVLQELLEIGPEDSGAVWDLLGEAFFAQGAFDRAVLAAEHALQSADPAHPAWQRYSQRHTLYVSRLDAP
jgi:superkiller protein 3